PISYLKTRGVVLRVPHKNVLRRQAAVIQAFAVGVSHRLAELPDKRQALTEGETGELLTEIAIKADGVGVVLEHEGWAKLRLTIIEGTLNAFVLHSLQHPEFPLRGARQAVASLGSCNACIGIDSDASAYAGGCVAGSKVLPVFTLAQQLREFVIADATTAAW